MKFPTKCRTMKLVMIYTILGSFCSFLNWEGAQNWPRKIPVIYLYTLEVSILKNMDPYGVHSVCVEDKKVV